jgi:phage shock protein B
VDPASFAIMMDTFNQCLQVICVLGLAGLIVFAIIWIVKIRTGWRLNKQDAAAMQDIAARLRQMDSRGAPLEKILDAEVPDWRGNVDQAGGIYGRQAG